MKLRGDVHSFHFLRTVLNIPTALIYSFITGLLVQEFKVGTLLAPLTAKPSPKPAQVVTSPGAWQENDQQTLTNKLFKFKERSFLRMTSAARPQKV